jgi:hypothetical protein
MNESQNEKSYINVAFVFAKTIGVSSFYHPFVYRFFMEFHNLFKQQTLTINLKCSNYHSPTPAVYMIG